MQLPDVLTVLNVFAFLGGDLPSQEVDIVPHSSFGSEQHPFNSEGIFSEHNIKSTLQDSDLIYRPVVIWHGLGDNYNASGIHNTKELLNSMYPGIFVHPIYLDLDPGRDQQRLMFGDANDELDTACEQLLEIPELKLGFDAIGFSQGGLFLRALVERCTLVKIHKLITFGSPHMGVLELPLCRNKNDWLCQRRNQILKSQVWMDRVQKTVIPAQYFRDPDDFDNYVLHSNFLSSINNERPTIFRPSYKRNMEALEKLVLVAFEQDTTLVPKQLAHFWDRSKEEQIPFEQTRIYKWDLLGLQKLYEEGKIDFLNVDAEHMRIPDDFFESIAKDYLGTILV